jgi:hypothetical protein
MTRALTLTFGLSAVLLIACGGPQTEGGDTGNWNDSDADTDSDSDSDTDSDTDTDTDTDVDYWEPVAVGFEYIGGFDAENKALTGWTYSDGSPAENYVLVTLAELDYFSTGDEGTYCELYYTYYVEGEGDFKSYEAGDPNGANPWGTHGSQATTWASWEGTLSLYGSSVDNGYLCENLDPAEWEDGAPYSRLENMQFGMGFGPQSEYIHGNWEQKTQDLYGENGFTSYIAINHPDGDGVAFDGYNWTSSYLWQWDSVGGEISVDEDDYLQVQPHYDGGSSGWVTSYARWYEDFPNLDLDQMTTAH